MDVEILQREPVRYAYLRHIGPYYEIGSTFGKMASRAAEAGLLGKPGALLAGVYHDDPMVNPPEGLRSDAGVALIDDAPAPAGLEEGTIAGGKRAKGVHKSPYARMMESWSALYETIHETGIQPRPGPPFELYISDMDTTPEDELVTEIYVPVA